MASRLGILLAIVSTIIVAFIFAVRSASLLEKKYPYPDIVSLMEKKYPYPDIVSRKEWGARPPKEKINVSVPVPFVVIHHTFEPAYCNTSEGCKEDMRTIQDWHQIKRGWWDIGYNFCVGGTGKIYEGRGWDIQGAHAPRYNNKSTGICFIGDYMETLPTEVMMEAAFGLIQMGVDKGHIADSYKLIGHRQVRETECPGNRFFEEIKTWPHWDPLHDVVPYKPT